MRPPANGSGPLPATARSMAPRSAISPMASSSSRFRQEMSSSLSDWTDPHYFQGEPMKSTHLMLAATAAVCLSVSALAQRPASGHANALTAQEQQEGWMLLFDGKSLDKWTVTPALAK